MEYSVVSVIDTLRLPPTVIESNENEPQMVNVAAKDTLKLKPETDLEPELDTDEEDTEDSNDSIDNELDLDDLPVFHSSSRRSTILPMSPGYPCGTQASTPINRSTPGSPMIPGSPGTPSTSVPYSESCMSPSVQGSSKIPPPATVSLYIGDLHQDTTETMLYTIFAACGPIASIKICRDSHTQKSLGYGYVNYQTKEAGDRAINELGYTKILGRECRVSKAITAQIPGGVKNMPKGGNIYIRNLHASVDSKQLWNTFKQYGPVLSCKVATNPHTGVSLCRGYVQYEAADHAQLAIRMGNGMDLNGQEITVDMYLTKGEREQVLQSTKASAQGNLRICGLPPGCSEQDIYDIFEPFGVIHSVYFTPHSPAPQQTQSVSRVGSPDGRANQFQGAGWGYVNYNSFKSALVAKNVVDGYYFHRSCIRVVLLDKPDTTKTEDSASANMVIIRKLAPSVDIPKVVDLLKEYTFVDPAELVIRMYRELPGHTVRSCTVECRSQDSQANIVANLNERHFHGYFLIVYAAAVAGTPSPGVPERADLGGSSTMRYNVKSSSTVYPEKQQQPWAITMRGPRSAQSETQSPRSAGPMRTPVKEDGQGTWKQHFCVPEEHGESVFSEHRGRPGKRYGPRSGTSRERRPRDVLYVHHVPRPAVHSNATVAGYFYFGEVARVAQADATPSMVVVDDEQRSLAPKCQVLGDDASIHNQGAVDVLECMNSSTTNQEIEMNMNKIKVNNIKPPTEPQAGTRSERRRGRRYNQTERKRKQQRAAQLPVNLD